MNPNSTITLTHEQCAELVERIVEQAKEQARVEPACPADQVAFALGVLKSKATDWLAQLEELRGEILKLK
jgi:hypothetical protein